jgi:hypothetical protein
LNKEASLGSGPFNRVSPSIPLLKSPIEFFLPIWYISDRLEGVSKIWLMGFLLTIVSVNTSLAQLIAGKELPEQISPGEKGRPHGVQPNKD